MEEDMYGDGGGEPAPADAAPPEDQGGQTAMLPKEIAPGKNPGDTISLIVVSTQEDSYQVQAGGGAEETAATPPTAAPETDDAYA